MSWAIETLTVGSDFPSTTLLSGNTTAPTPGQVPTWTWAGCCTPAPPEGMSIDTLVCAPIGVIVTLPPWLASRPGPKFSLIGACAETTAVLAASAAAARSTASLRTGYAPPDELLSSYRATARHLARDGTPGLRCVH